MSSRTPAELIWQEHSKPAIQNEFSRGWSSGLMGRMVVLAGDHVLLALVVHEALAPLPFELEVTLGARATSRQCDMLDRDFRGPIRVEQAIGLLVRVAELGVAEAGQHRQRAHDLQQVQV